ncbi:MAG: ImmA/IrrE family metallo-endopeptidase [Oscillibacter sp.]|nr:ImmA/IrrE family metallo-endopeptidase [Oscillibacter sp.]
MKKDRGVFAAPDAIHIQSICTDMRDWVTDLFYIYNLTCQILNGFYKEKGRPDSGLFPIPIDDIVTWLGFKLEYTDLNRYRDRMISLILGKVDAESRVIYIDNGIGVSVSQQRYAMAHELGHVYLQECSESASAKCSESRIPSSKYEILADVFAAFLMLPPEETFEYICKYIVINQKRPIDHEKMMLELSGIARFPFLRTVTSYEYLRIVACYERNEREKILPDLKKRYGIDDSDWLPRPIAAGVLYG